MKAPFNTRCDIYYGPEGTTPGALRASDVPCRFVPDLCFVDVELPLLDSTQYLTVEELIPTGPSFTETDVGKYAVNFQVADRISLEVGLPPTLVVYRVESRVWDTGEEYWRAHLGPEFPAGDVGCDSYQLSPWGVHIDRTGPMMWGDGDSIMTTDGEGNWDLEDVGDGIHYYASAWDGHGTQTFATLDDPPMTVDVICQEGE